MMLTLSNDACVLWSTTAPTTIRKERQLFSQNGCYFEEAKFSSDGRMLGTLFRDGRLIIWELDGISGLPNRQQDGQLAQLKFPSNNVKLFDLGQDSIVGGGPQFPYLAIKRGFDSTNQSTAQSEGFQLYKLPKEARGVEQIRFLTDRLLLGYISEGVFYLVDLGQHGQKKLQIALEISIPGCSIKRFAVDFQMNALTLCATNGNVLLYNLPTAIQNEQAIARKRVQMGIEKELVHTYLELVEVAVEELPGSSQSALIAVDDQESSSVQHQHQLVHIEGANSNLQMMANVASADGLHSHRQVQMQTTSPLLSTDQRAYYFNSTEQLSQQKQQPLRPLILPSSHAQALQQDGALPNTMTTQTQSTVRSPEQLMNHMLSQKTMNIPMPTSLKSVTDSEHRIYPAGIEHVNFAAPQVLSSGMMQQYAQTQQRPLSLGSGGLQNMSQSSVAGPYQRLTYNPTSQPLAMPTLNQGAQKVSTHDALIQGIPTALMTQTMGNMASTPLETVTEQNFAHSIDLSYQPDFKETDQTSDHSSTIAQFNIPKLRRLLKQYGQLPDKYRTLTWKYLLKLPLNKQAFQALLNRGVHPAFKDLHKRFPVSSYRLYNKLVRILSAIGYWSPIFLDVQYLPQIVFPFLKKIPNDDLLVFEVIMSLIMQWMQCWFEVHPAEPLAVCQAIEQILAKQDQKLFAHLHSLNFTARDFAWPFLFTLFTKTLTNEDWLRLVDHLFMRSSEPELLLYFVTAYLLSSKQQLMQIGCIEDLSVFLESPSTIQFKKLYSLAEQLHSELKQSIFTGTVAQNLPIGAVEGSYQTFTRYPDHFVTFQNRLRIKIVNQEEEIQKKNDILVDLKEKSKEILEQEQRMRLQQEAMARAEAERKDQVRTEMENLLQERIRLDELQRKARLEHIQAVETAIKTSMTQQERLREADHRHINEEVGAIQRQQKYEYESRMQDEMIANLELKANQKMLEQMQKQQQEEHSRRTREKLDLLQKEVLQRQKDSMRRWEEQREDTRRQNQMLNHQLKVQQEQLNSIREQDIIEQQFSKLRLDQQQMEAQLHHEKQSREEERTRLEKEFKVREDANRQLVEEREKMRKEQEEREAMLRKEHLELERLRYEEKRDRDRLQQITEERQREIEMARVARTQNMIQDAKMQEERQKMAEERETIIRNREHINMKEQTETEGRDFMNMLRTTADNVREIVKDGERHLAEEREIRESQDTYQTLQGDQLKKVEASSRSQPQFSLRDQQSQAQSTIRDAIPHPQVISRDYQMQYEHQSQNQFSLRDQTQSQNLRDQQHQAKQHYEQPQMYAMRRDQQPQKSQSPANQYNERPQMFAIERDQQPQPSYPQVNQHKEHPQMYSKSDQLPQANLNAQELRSHMKTTNPIEEYQPQQQHSQNKLSWVMSHPKYTQSEPILVSEEERRQRLLQEEQQKLVESVISERERLVREQNESLKAKLSQQYMKLGNQQNQQMHTEEDRYPVQDNEGLTANQNLQNYAYTIREPDQSSHTGSLQNPKIYQQMAQRYSGQGSSAKPLAYMTPSSTEESNFSEESSDVESYHHSKIKQVSSQAYTMTQVPTSSTVPHQVTHHVTQSSDSSLPFPQRQQQQKQMSQPVQLIQTQLMPQNHQQLAQMPQSKSSIGQDISSSFVSSATESGLDGSKPTLNYDDVSNTDTSLMSSQNSQVYQQMQQQILQQHHQQQYQHPQVDDKTQQDAMLGPSNQTLPQPGGAYHSNMSSNLAERHQALTSLAQSQSSNVSSSLQASIL